MSTLCDPIKCSRQASLSFIISLSLSTQVEDGNFRLSTRSLEHSPVTSPASSQKKKFPHPKAPTPDFVYKNFFQKPTGVPEHESHFLLAWPCSKPFSAPNSHISVGPHCAGVGGMGYANLHLVTDAGCDQPYLTLHFLLPRALWVAPWISHRSPMVGAVACCPDPSGSGPSC